VNVKVNINQFLKEIISVNITHNIKINNIKINIVTEYKINTNIKLNITIKNRIYQNKLFGNQYVVQLQHYIIEITVLITIKTII
jgi:hypothetical protein